MEIEVVYQESFAEEEEALLAFGKMMFGTYRFEVEQEPDTKRWFVRLVKYKK